MANMFLISPNWTERMRDALLAMLSDYDYKTSFSKARSEQHEGTGLWLFDCPEYREWDQADESCGLWVYGIRKQYLNPTDFVICSREALNFG